MKKILVFLCAVMLVLGVAGMASATVLDFEDLYTTTSQPIPDGYHGFNWSSATQIGVVNGLLGTGYDYGSVSGDMVAFNYYGYTPSNIDLVGSGAFDFNGAWFTSAWYDQNVSFKGYSDGTLQYTSSDYAINTTVPMWIGLDWTGIDRLVIDNTNAQWAMDDFTYNESGAPIPEPATVLLLGTGLIGLAGIGRKRFRRNS